MMLWPMFCEKKEWKEWEKGEKGEDRRPVYAPACPSPSGSGGFIASGNCDRVLNKNQQFCWFEHFFQISLIPTPKDSLSTVSPVHCHKKLKATASTKLRWLRHNYQRTRSSHWVPRTSSYFFTVLTFRWNVTFASIQLEGNRSRRCVTDGWQGGRHKIGTLTGRSCGVHWPNLTNKPHPLYTRPPVHTPHPPPNTHTTPHQIMHKNLFMEKVSLS